MTLALKFGEAGIDFSSDIAIHTPRIISEHKGPHWIISSEWVDISSEGQPFDLQAQTIYQWIAVLLRV